MKRNKSYNVISFTTRHDLHHDEHMQIILDNKSNIVGRNICSFFAESSEIYKWLLLITTKTFLFDYGVLTHNMHHPPQTILTGFKTLQEADDFFMTGKMRNNQLVKKIVL